MDDLTKSTWEKKLVLFLFEILSESHAGMATHVSTAMLILSHPPAHFHIARNAALAAVKLIPFRGIWTSRPTNRVTLRQKTHTEKN